MQNSKVVITIPLHKGILKPTEELSITRCVEVWGEKYDICIIAPEGEDMSEIKGYFPHLLLRRVEAHKMSSIKEYNKLLLSEEFYAMFTDYDYMLVYQADCFVFHDDLENWVSKGYDYVGAPWYFECSQLEKFYGRIFRSLGLYHGDGFRYGEVGNGGLSLRKISAFLNHIKTRKPLTKRAQEGRLNEDVYWSMVAKELTKPTAEEASHFCGDMNPTICPEDVMSAHGWNKTNDTVNYWHDRIKRSYE